MTGVSSGRIWSLWDMLKKFETAYVLGSLNYVSQTERKLRSDIEQMRDELRKGDCVYNLVLNDQRRQLVINAQNLMKAAQEYELPGVSSAAEEVRNFLTSDRNYNALDYDEVVRIHALLHTLYSTALHVMNDISIFVLTRGSSEYVSGEKVGFGPDVEEAFPSAVPDSHEASKCLGLERWTACVMHCMRALEAPLQTLEDAVPVRVPKEQWGDKINQIEAAIKAMNKGTHPKADVQWFADAATQFHFMKTAWRNYAHHLLHTYDEERATEIYDATRRFMRHLSTRLSEPSPSEAV